MPANGITWLYNGTHLSFLAPKAFSNSPLLSDGVQLSHKNWAHACFFFLLSLFFFFFHFSAFSFTLRSPRSPFIVSPSQCWPWLCHSWMDTRLQWWFATEIPHQVKEPRNDVRWTRVGVFFGVSKNCTWPTVLVDRYCWDQSVSFLYVDVFPPSETTFTVTGLQPVTTYNFSVNALNAIGESEYADNNAVLTITTKGQFGVTPL